MPKRVYSVMLDDELLAALKADAAEQNLTPSALLRVILHRYVREIAAGKTPAEKSPGKTPQEKPPSKNPPTKFDGVW